MTIQEEFDMMLKINPNLLGKQNGSFGIRPCPKCKKLLEWIDNKWYCNCK